jgi:hypothetical protein
MEGVRSEVKAEMSEQVSGSLNMSRQRARLAARSRSSRRAQPHGGNSASVQPKGEEIPLGKSVLFTV